MRTLTTLVTVLPQTLLLILLFIVQPTATAYAPQSHFFRTSAIPQYDDLGFYLQTLFCGSLLELITEKYVPLVEELQNANVCATEEDESVMRMLFVDVVNSKDFHGVVKNPTRFDVWKRFWTLGRHRKQPDQLAKTLFDSLKQCNSGPEQAHRTTMKFQYGAERMNIYEWLQMDDSQTIRDHLVKISGYLNEENRLLKWEGDAIGAYFTALKKLLTSPDAAVENKHFYVDAVGAATFTQFKTKVAAGQCDNFDEYSNNTHTKTVGIIFDNWVSEDKVKAMDEGLRALEQEFAVLVDNCLNAVVPAVDAVDPTVDVVDPVAAVDPTVAAAAGTAAPAVDPAAAAAAGLAVTALPAVKKSFKTAVGLIIGGVFLMVVAVIMYVTIDSQDVDFSDL